MLALAFNTRSITVSRNRKHFGMLFCNSTIEESVHQEKLCNLQNSCFLLKEPRFCAIMFYAALWDDICLP